MGYYYLTNKSYDFLVVCNGKKLSHPDVIIVPGTEAVPDFPTEGNINKIQELISSLKENSLLNKKEISNKNANKSSKTVIATEAPVPTEVPTVAPVAVPVISETPTETPTEAPIEVSSTTVSTENLTNVQSTKKSKLISS